MSRDYIPASDIPEHVARSLERIGDALERLADAKDRPSDVHLHFPDNWTSGEATAVIDRVADILIAKSAL